LAAKDAKVAKISDWEILTAKSLARQSRKRSRKLNFHHEGPSAAEPQPNLGIFSQRRKDAKFLRKKMFPIFALLASWRDENLNPSLRFARICARRANFEIQYEEHEV
jgi:hypothetical protein